MFVRTNKIHFYLLVMDTLFPVCTLFRFTLLDDKLQNYLIKVLAIHFLTT